MSYVWAGTSKRHLCRKKEESYTPVCGAKDFKTKTTTQSVCRECRLIQKRIARQLVLAGMKLLLCDKGKAELNDEREDLVAVAIELGAVPLHHVTEEDDAEE